LLVVLLVKRSFIFIFFLPLILLAQNKGGSSFKIDSLRQALALAKADTSIVNIKNNLGAELCYKGEYEEAFTCLQQALALATKLQYKKGIAAACHRVASVYWNRADYGNALASWLKAQKIYEELNDLRGMANVSLNLSNVYAKLGNDEKALESYLNALGTATKINDKDLMGVIYVNLGDLFASQARTAKTGEAKKAKYQLALDNLMKGLTLSREAGNKSIESQACISMGNVYYGLGNLEKGAPAKQWYEKDLAVQFKALKIKEELGDKRGMYLCYMSIGIAYYMLDDLAKTEENLNRSLALSKQIGYKTGIKEAYGNLSQLAEEKGDYKKAFTYEKLFSAMKDSVLSEASARQLTDMMEKYQSEKKQKENEVLQQQASIRELEIRQGRLWILALTLLSVLILGFALLWIRQNRRTAFYEKIEMQQKLLRSQMNPHFIFNAMVGIQNYIYREEPETAANYLSSVVHLMRSIIDNSKREYVALEKEITGLQHYLALQQVRFQDKFDFKIDIDPAVDAGSLFVPPMMAQPFIENAIVHGVLKKINGKGRITVNFYLDSGFLALAVTDNGVGRQRTDETLKDEMHLSVATGITRERLAILNRRSKQKSSFTITDLKDTAGEPVGTEVTFLFALRGAE
jgi:tetratricopeptide (TPR) repeat protein